MDLDLSEREARLVRAQLVRHLVELEDEMTHADGGMLKDMLAGEITVLRSVYERLAQLLDARPSSGNWRASSDNGFR